MDKLPNKEKSNLNLKGQTDPEVNSRTLEVILRSFRRQVNFFLEINVVQWISC